MTQLKIFLYVGVFCVLLLYLSTFIGLNNKVAQDHVFHPVEEIQQQLVQEKPPPKWLCFEAIGGLTNQKISIMMAVAIAKVMAPSEKTPIKTVGLTPDLPSLQPTSVVNEQGTCASKSAAGFLQQHKQTSSL